MTQDIVVAFYLNLHPFSRYWSCKWGLGPLTVTTGLNCLNFDGGRQLEMDEGWERLSGNNSEEAWNSLASWPGAVWMGVFTCVAGPVCPRNRPEWRLWDRLRRDEEVKLSYWQESQTAWTNCTWKLSYIICACRAAYVSHRSVYCLHGTNVCVSACPPELQI